MFIRSTDPHIQKNQAVESKDSNSQKDTPDERKHRRVLHRGRAWTEKEEDAFQKSTIPSLPQPPLMCWAFSAVYADSLFIEKAQRYLYQLTTIEEKVAQLCFLVTEAVYDATLQREVELLIQTWQIGGVLFRKGEYRRQAYLIERLREISKFPLLFANDYFQGLSFYLQGADFPKNIFSEQHYSDMGKAVMVQNRRLGVQIQFDRERTYQSSMSEVQAKAFRKGIRRAHGIVGKEKIHSPQIADAHFIKEPLSFFSKKEEFLTSNFVQYQVQETISVKTLNFFDATQLGKNCLDEKLCEAFKKVYDLFLFSENLAEGIRTVARLVRSSKICEEVLDRHVMKVLIIKSLFFS